LRIGKQTLQILESRARKLSASDPARMVSEQSPPAILALSVRAELRLVMEQIIVSLSERRLRMLDFLEDLKR
jgi:hypothetical protein